MDGRHQDVTGPVVGQLHDEFREVGFNRVDALFFQRLVEFDFVGRDGLDLNQFVHRVRLGNPGHDFAGFPRVPGPVHLPAACPDALFQFQQAVGEVRQRSVLGRGAEVAQLLPVGQLGHHVRPLVADGVGHFAEVGAELRLKHLLAGGLRKGLGGVKSSVVTHVAAVRLRVEGLRVKGLKV